MDRADKMDRIGPNRAKADKMDRIGPNRTKVDKIDQRNKVDRI